MYPKNDPKLVQATSVQYATVANKHVNVVAYDERFEMCVMYWSNTMEKSTSNVLVKNNQGDWLRIWFYDTDIMPYS